MSHAHGDMDMDMGSGTSSDAASGHGMMAVFQNSMATSLFSEAWTPRTTGTYAATCIFLIAFSAIFRGLLALRNWQENRWLDAEMKRRYVVVAGQGTLAERVSNDSMAKHMVLSNNGVEENVMVVQRHGAQGRPFRLSVDPIRAVLDTVIAGVGYLLMLAVMTMNIGYFISVLGGVFIGSLLCGRYVAHNEH